MTSESPVAPVNPLSALRFAAGTDIGLRREENQDAHGIIDGKDFRAFFVCDGMGGVQGGAIASNLAVTTIRDFIKELPRIGVTEISSAITQANANIFERGSHETGLAGMGTTCVGLVFTDEKMFVANVGDSRAYRVRAGHVEQLTEDHTLVQELVRSGAIAPEAAGNHPVSHMLTRSLGPAPTIEVDCVLSFDGPARGDRYVVCCDGLYNMVGAEEFVEILENFSLDDAVQELIDLANLRGGTDNITLIIIEVGESYPVGPEKFGIVVSTEAGGQGRAGVEAPEAGEAPDASMNGAAAEEPAVERAVEREEPALQPDGADGAKGGVESVETPAQERSTRDVSEGAAASGSAASEPFESGIALVSVRERIEGFIRALSRVKSSEWLGSLASLFAVLALGFGIGYLYSHSSRSESDVRRDASSEIGGAATGAETQVARDVTAPPTVAPLIHDGEREKPALHGDAASDIHVIDASERARLQKRYDTLKKTVRDLDAKIASFSRPISGRLGETLDLNRKAIEGAEAELESIRADLDMATRKLAVWYGRRKRLQETDPINLASEVAAAVPAVRTEKENFERATWAYLKEAEVLRYDPANKAQSERVAKLGRERTDRMTALAQTIRGAIEREVGQADRRISELTIKRDEKEGELDTLRREVEYVKILMGADADARAAKKVELQRAREVAAAELDGLSAVFGTSENDFVPFN